MIKKGYALKKSVGIACATLMILLSAHNAWSLPVVSLDFEDGLLPSAHGWVPIKQGSGSTSIIAATTNKGVSKVLCVSGSNTFGWAFDLVGLVDPAADWIFAADLAKTFPNAGLFYDSCDEIAQINTGEMESDPYWHNYRIEMNHANNEIAMFLDDVFLRSRPIGYWGPTYRGFLSDAETYIAVYWSNISQSGTFFADNISFEVTPVPGPGPEPVAEPTVALLVSFGVSGLATSRKWVKKI